jgi:triacylglycerol esterase/lipase EstA (alpha/beta hydrolase family)
MLIPSNYYKLPLPYKTIAVPIMTTRKGLLAMNRLIYTMCLLLGSQMVAAKECVVLLHGLGRSTWSMHTIENSLQKAGYQVVNQSYLSRERSIDELSAVVGQGIAACQQYQTLLSAT